MQGSDELEQNTIYCDIPIIIKPKPKKLSNSVHIKTKLTKNQNSNKLDPKCLTPINKNKFFFMEQKDDLNDDDIFSNNEKIDKEIYQENKFKTSLKLKLPSIEEMKNDFQKLKAKQDIHKTQLEILNVLEGRSTASNSYDLFDDLYDLKDEQVVERPQNPFS